MKSNKAKDIRRINIAKKKLKRAEIKNALSTAFWQMSLRRFSHPKHLCGSVVASALNVKVRLDFSPVHPEADGGWCASSPCDGVWTPLHRPGLCQPVADTGTF